MRKGEIKIGRVAVVKAGQKAKEDLEQAGVWFHAYKLLGRSGLIKRTMSCHAYIDFGESYGGGWWIPYRCLTAKRKASK